MDEEKWKEVSKLLSSGGPDIKVLVDGKEVDASNIEFSDNSLEKESYFDPPKKFVDPKAKNNRVKRGRSKVKLQKKSRKANRRKK